MGPAAVSFKVVDLSLLVVYQLLLLQILMRIVSRGGWAALPRGATGCLQFVIVVFPDHTHLLFLCLICVL